MNHAAQLERLAKLPQAQQVGIYSLESKKGVQTWLWLCGRHLEARIASGWVIRGERPPPHDLGCQDCQMEVSR